VEVSMIGSVPDMFVRSKSSAAFGEMGARAAGTRVKRADWPVGRIMLVALALVTTSAEAQPVMSEALAEAHARDAAQVVRLNGAIQRRNDDIARQNAAAQAAFARGRAAYEAARLQNDRARADADAAADAYRRRRADYDASLARWRAGEARRSEND
jgi:hypothetical protein